jgi:hypothetical protein
MKQMSSVDTRINREAKLYQEEVDVAKRRRLERLRMLLDDEVLNMLLRGRIVTRTKDKKVNADWLHHKTFDQTYRDFGIRTKRYRTRVRFENLLKLCDGDKKLLQDEYDRSLNKYFPIPGKRYEWGSRLTKAFDDRVTAAHGWRLRKLA